MHLHHAQTRNLTLMDVGERRSNTDGHLGTRAALLDEIKSSKMESERTSAAFSLFTGSTPLDADAGEKLVARDLELGLDLELALELDLELGLDPLLDLENPPEP